MPGVSLEQRHWQLAMLLATRRASSIVSQHHIGAGKPLRGDSRPRQTAGTQTATGTDRTGWRLVDADYNITLNAQAGCQARFQSPWLNRVKLTAALDAAKSL
jgi:hypothetical protein